MKEIEVKEAGKRIDIYLNELLDLSRTTIQKMCETGHIKVNNNTIKSSYKVKLGDIIIVEMMPVEPMSAKPQKMDLDIVYEDDDIIVVNKANGVVVHPAVGNPSNTLVNGLIYHSNQLSDINGEFRPGIVHRIDAYTTGLLVIAKNNQAHENLAKQLEMKKTHRKYVALVWGVINEDTGTIDAPIGRDQNNRKKMTVTDINAKEAITHFKVLERYDKATLIECQLETGRTHQIRVHMNYIKHPIINDPVYGNYPIINDFGQCLHAQELGFIHPKTKKYMEFSTPLPKGMLEIINMFKNS